MRNLGASDSNVDVGDVTERTERVEIPFGLTYPVAPQRVQRVPTLRFHAQQPVSPSAPTAPTAPMTLDDKPLARSPRGTPAPVPTVPNVFTLQRATAAPPDRRPSYVHPVVVVAPRPAQHAVQIALNPAPVYRSQHLEQSAPPAAPPYPVVHDLPSTAVHSKPWEQYEKLGLGEQALAAVHKRTSKLVVAAYRVLGFAILTLIVALLVGYIVESIFYFVNDSWVQPIVVSKGDEKIVTLSAQLAEMQNQRDRIASDLSQAEQAIARQKEFQTQFMNTVTADLAGRRAVLSKLRGIAGQYAIAGTKVANTNATYAAAERERLQREFDAGLIDRREMLAGNFQGAQITTSTLGIAEKRVETEQHAAELAMQVRSLEAIVGEGDAAGILSYDILKIKQEYDNSKLELNKALANREALKSSLARQDEVVKNLLGSSYLRALADNATVAFVPYSNMTGVTNGVVLYGCKLGMVACHQVGRVIEVLPGEIQQKHPHRDKMVRGQLVEVSIEDGSAAQDDVLFLGGKPMWF